MVSRAAARRKLQKSLQPNDELSLHTLPRWVCPRGCWLPKSRHGTWRAPGLPKPTLPKWVCPRGSWQPKSRNSTWNSPTRSDQPSPGVAFRSSKRDLCSPDSRSALLNANLCSPDSRAGRPRALQTRARAGRPRTLRTRARPDRGLSGLAENNRNNNEILPINVFGTRAASGLAFLARSLDSLSRLAPRPRSPDSLSGLAV